MKNREVAFKARALELALRPNARRIAEIASNGDIAVVVFEAQGEVADLAKLLGWDGLAPVFQLCNAKRILFASSGIDQISSRWLTRNTEIPRVFLVTGLGTLLLNFIPGSGWQVEPGSVDSEVS
jgi:hypothetical protein